MIEFIKAVAQLAVLWFDPEKRSKAYRLEVDKKLAQKLEMAEHALLEHSTYRVHVAYILDILANSPGLLEDSDRKALLKSQSRIAKYAKRFWKL